MWRRYAAGWSGLVPGAEGLHQRLLGQVLRVGVAAGEQ